MRIIRKYPHGKENYSKTPAVIRILEVRITAGVRLLFFTGMNSLNRAGSHALSAVGTEFGID